MMKHVLAIVAVLSFAVVANAGVVISGADAPDHINSLGQEVYILTATSDAGAISSVGIKVESDGRGTMAQIHPAGQNSPDMNSNNFFAFVGAEVDHDTQAMFDTTPGEVLVVGGTDTADLLEINITGFAAAASLDVVQIVLNEGDIVVATIGAVVDGVEYTTVTDVPVPEPASLGLLAIGSLLAIRRR